MIARRLQKVAPGCNVELEARVREIMEHARAVKRGKPPQWLRIGGRFDIVLWWKRKKGPRALIEVKHPVRNGQISSVMKDVARIGTALRRGSDERVLQWGCVAFFCTTGPEESKKGRRHAHHAIAGTLRTLSGRVQEAAAKLGVLAQVRQARGRLVTDQDAQGKRYGKFCCVQVRPISG